MSWAAPLGKSESAPKEGSQSRPKWPLPRLPGRSSLGGSARQRLAIDGSAFRPFGNASSKVAAPVSCKRAQFLATVAMFSAPERIRGKHGRAERTLMRWLCETHFDNGIVGNRACSRRRECGEPRELFPREGNDFHVLPQQDHASTGTAIGRLPKPKKPPKSITTMISLYCRGPVAHVPENVLAFNGAQNVSAQKVAGPHGLREAHGRRRRQAHAGWRRHTAWRGTLCWAAPATRTSAPQMCITRIDFTPLIFLRTMGSPSTPRTRPDTCLLLRWQ